MKLSTLLAINQKPRADHENGVTSVILQSVLLLPLILYERKLLERFLARRKITGFEQLAHVLESGTSASATGRQFGVPRQTVRLWLHRYQTTGTVSKHTPQQQWAPTE